MTPININSLKQSVPSVFATTPSPKMSGKYTFVPTIDILEKFEQEGWDVYSAKQMGRGVYGSHELRLRNGDIPQVGDSFVEAIIRNSHNGLLKFSVSAGLHRLVCSNGLTVPTSISSAISVKHMRVDISSVREITDEFAKKLPRIQTSVDKMQNTIMKEVDIMDFVGKASLLRLEGGVLPSRSMAEEIMAPLREEDKGNSAWQVFNVVQEKFVRGGIKVPTKNGKSSSLRELKNFQKINKINTQLWELAESYC